MHHSPMNVNMTVPGDNAAVLVKVLPQGRLEILVGHLPEVEGPDIVNKMLRDFFG